MLFLIQLCYQVDDTGAAYESRQYFIIEVERRGMKLYDLNKPILLYLIPLKFIKRWIVNAKYLFWLYQGRLQLTNLIFFAKEIILFSKDGYGPVFFKRLITEANILNTDPQH